MPRYIGRYVSPHARCVRCRLPEVEHRAVTDTDTFRCPYFVRKAPIWMRLLNRVWR